MASANVELVRSIYASWERGDYGDAEWADPEIELVFSDVVDLGSWKGLDGLAEGWRRYLSSWDEFRTGADEYLEVDAERVLVLNYFTGRGKASGLEVGEMHAKGASLFEVRDGKVTRIVLYTDRERALADVAP